MFCFKGKRLKANNLRNRTPGPGAYPIYGEFMKHPYSQKSGWVFPKAERKVVNTIKKANFFGSKSRSMDQRKRHNRNILGEAEPSPGPGSYNVFNSGIGKGFGAPPMIERRRYRSHSRDRRNSSPHRCWVRIITFI